MIPTNPTNPTNQRHPYVSDMEAISTHLLHSATAHINCRNDFLKAALRSIEKLRFSINTNMGVIIDTTTHKKGDFKSICELCGLQLPSIKTLIIGHYIPYYVCINCHSLNESIKSNMNTMLPRSEHITLFSFQDELKKVGGVMPITLNKDKSEGKSESKSEGE